MPDTGKKLCAKSCGPSSSSPASFKSLCKQHRLHELFPSSFCKIRAPGSGWCFVHNYMQAFITSYNLGIHGTVFSTCIWPSWGQGFALIIFISLSMVWFAYIIYILKEGGKPVCSGHALRWPPVNHTLVYPLPQSVGGTCDFFRQQNMVKVMWESLPSLCYVM